MATMHLPPSYYNSNESPFATRTSPNDACIISSDDYTLYIDRFLLSYVSPVFKDMYEINCPSSSLNSTDPEQPDTSLANVINLSETAETLDILFHHVDPTRGPPRLTIRQLFSVISAAQKYQMEGALSRLRSSLTVPSIIRCPSPSLSPLGGMGTKQSSRPVNLIVSNPLPVVVLAHTFGFHEELRMALRELARIHIDMIVKNEQDCLLPAEVFQYILQLRRQRGLWIKTKAKLIFGYPLSSQNPTTTTTAGGWLGGGGTTTVVQKDCMHCMRQRALHIHEACVKVDDSPCWDTFKAEIYRTYSNKCSSCGGLTIPTGNDKFNNDFVKWTDEARDMESELPEWPPVYGEGDWHR